MSRTDLTDFCQLTSICLLYLLNVSDLVELMIEGGWEEKGGRSGGVGERDGKLRFKDKQF